ncbi:hypothetical protein HZS_8020 [Henneguya salminicola]|nr:hypothetical protein HZS_8020 [Henneguya salminicola]
MLFLNFRKHFGNIYFPALYEEYTYTPYNYGLRPSSYFPWHVDEKRIVQFYINASFLVGVVALSNSTQNNCILFKIDTKKFDERCIIGNQVLKINNEFALLSIDCTKYSFVLLIKMIHSCNQTLVESKPAIFHLLLAFSNFKKSRQFFISHFKDKSDIIVTAWMRGETKIGITSFPFNFSNPEQLKNGYQQKIIF